MANIHVWLIFSTFAAVIGKRILFSFSRERNCNKTFKQYESGKPFKTAERQDEWYSLDGQRLAGKPTKAGLYIKNGKTIVIRQEQ